MLTVYGQGISFSVIGRSVTWYWLDGFKTLPVQLDPGGLRVMLAKMGVNSLTLAMPRWGYGGLGCFLSALIRQFFEHFEGFSERGITG